MPDHAISTDHGSDRGRNYRPDIDGLRAVSIIAVVGYHAFPALVPGGFVGVDIFFVISGCLITQIISGQLAAGSFSVAEFYRRRIRRIFPALIAVLLLTYAIGWIVLLPSDFSLLAENILGGAGFVANLLQWRSTDYFAADSASNPLLHLWSLGIEEQFYIVWPLLLIWMGTGQRRTRLIIVIAVLSMAANIYLAATDRTAAFYSPGSRAWELLAGALLVDTGGGWRRTLGNLSDDVKSIAGIGLIAAAVVLFDKTSAYPGWRALLPVVGAMMLLDARQSVANRFLLSHRVMVGVGLISYPLYLWHFPLLTYLNIIRAGSPTILDVVGVVLVSGLLAWITFRLIERPQAKDLYTVRSLCTALVSIALVAAVTIGASGFAFRFPSEIRQLASVNLDAPSFRPGCFLKPQEDLTDFSKTCTEDGTGPVIFIWGDSTAAALYAGLKAEQQLVPFRIAQFTASSCRPMLGFDTPERLHCPAINDHVLGLIESSKPDVVVLHALWQMQDADKLKATIDRLKALAVKRIVLLGPTPKWGKRGLPQITMNEYRFRRRLIAERSIAQISGADIDATMQRLAQDNGIEYISAWRAFCDPDGCVTRVGASAADLVAFDSAHLTRIGSIFLVQHIAQSLLAPTK